MNTAVDSDSKGLAPNQCPLCHQENACTQARGGSEGESCWCEQIVFPEELRGRIPESSLGRACICRRCIVKALQQRPLPVAGPGDYHIDPQTGRWIFTESYHRKRGYCCDNGCRHCPWKAHRTQATTPTTPHRPDASWIGGALLFLYLATAAPLLAATWSEDFSSDPSTRGWKASGEIQRFTWNAAAGRLDVQWDTLGAHSFFAHPITPAVAPTDAFALSFDLQLNHAEGGVRQNRPGAMQVAVGFLNWTRATSQNYQRGAGKAFETLEFNWFPEGWIPGFGQVDPTLSATAYDEAGHVAAQFTYPYAFPLDRPQRVQITHQPAPHQVVIEILEDGQPSARVTLPLSDRFGAFQFDAVAVLVWDERTSFGDSLQATGWIDNLTLITPDPPLGPLSLGESQRDIHFLSQRGWSYQLEATSDLGDQNSWQPLGLPISGTGETLTLWDTRKALFSRQYYRVQAVAE